MLVAAANSNSLDDMGHVASIYTPARALPLQPLRHISQLDIPVLFIFGFKLLLVDDFPFFL